MTFEQFNSSLQSEHPPEDISPLLLALWYDAKGDWEKSHRIAQDIDTEAGSLIHAYLHRKEGDLWNADYWYRLSGSTRPQMNLEAEWEKLVKSLIM